LLNFFNLKKLLSIIIFLLLLLLLLSFARAAFGLYKGRKEEKKEEGMSSREGKGRVCPLGEAKIWKFLKGFQFV